MIISYKDLAAIRNRNKNKNIVLCGGCFDLFHVGHLKFINEAKRCGDILVVAVISDEFVKKSKNSNRPIINEEDRSMIIDNLKAVDYTIILNKEDHEFKDDNMPSYDLSLIKKFRPIIDELHPDISFISKETNISEAYKNFLLNRNIKIIMKDYDSDISTSTIIKNIENFKTE